MPLGRQQVLALTANIEGIVPKSVLNTILLPFLRGESEPKAIPSAYWITYLFSVLAEHGYGEEVVAYIKKRWLPMAEHGTTWEGFTPLRGAESHSHAWSAHPLFHLMQLVGGITQRSPAWKAINFKPVFIGTRNRTVIPSPHGPITGTWHRKGAKIFVEIKLPKKTKAHVNLPGMKPVVVTEHAKWVITESSI